MVEDEEVGRFVRGSRKEQPKQIILYTEPDGRLRITCPECGWSRAFSKMQNAATKLSEHSMSLHRKRLFWTNSETWEDLS